MESQFGILLNVAEGDTGAGPRDVFLGVYRQGRSVQLDTVDPRPRALANRKGVDEFAQAAAGDSTFLFNVGERVLLKRPGLRARPLPISAAHRLDLSPDGKVIVCCSQEGDCPRNEYQLLSRVDVDTGERTALWRTGEYHISCFAICPSGEQVIVGLDDFYDQQGGADTLVYLDLLTGKTRPCFPDSGQGSLKWRYERLVAGQIALSPDGGRIAFVDPLRGHVFVRDLQGDKTVRLSLPPVSWQDKPVGPQFSPDGSRVLYCCGGKLWASASGGGSRPVLVYGDGRRRVMQAFPLGLSPYLDHFRNYSVRSTPLCVPPSFVRRRLCRKSMV